MAGKYNLSIDQGATFRLTFVWAESLTDADGNAILDDEGLEQAGAPFSIYGYDARLQVRKSVTTASTMLSLTDADGITISQPEATMLRYVQAAAAADVTLDGEQTIDGIDLVAGDRVLLMGQTDPSENGVYVVSASAWARATDADEAADLNLAAVWVYRGDEYAGKTFRQTASLLTLADAQTWELITSIGVVLCVMTPEQTGALTSSGVYDLELEAPDGAVTRVLQGKVRLSKEVTR